MFFRAVSRIICGPVPGDKFKRVMRVDAARGPLVKEEWRAQNLKKLMDNMKRNNENVIQKVQYD